MNRRRVLDDLAARIDALRLDHPVRVAVDKQDSDLLGGEAAARELYASRYRPAYALYERLCDPEASSDAVIDNDDLGDPQLHVRPDGRLRA